MPPSRELSPQGREALDDASSSTSAPRCEEATDDQASPIQEGVETPEPEEQNDPTADAESVVHDGRTSDSASDQSCGPPDEEEHDHQATSEAVASPNSWAGFLAVIAGLWTACLIRCYQIGEASEVKVRQALRSPGRDAQVRRIATTGIDGLVEHFYGLLHLLVWIGSYFVRTVLLKLRGVLVVFAVVLGSLHLAEPRIPTYMRVPLDHFVLSTCRFTPSPTICTIPFCVSSNLTALFPLTCSVFQTPSATDVVMAGFDESHNALAQSVALANIGCGTPRSLIDYRYQLNDMLDRLPRDSDQTRDHIQRFLDQSRPLPAKLQQFMFQVQDEGKTAIRQQRFTTELLSKLRHERTPWIWTRVYHQLYARGYGVTPREEAIEARFHDHMSTISKGTAEILTGASNLAVDFRDLRDTAKNLKHSTEDDRLRLGGQKADIMGNFNLIFRVWYQNGYPEPAATREINADLELTTDLWVWAQFAQDWGQEMATGLWELSTKQDSVLKILRSKSSRIRFRGLEQDLAGVTELDEFVNSLQSGLDRLHMNTEAHEKLKLAPDACGRSLRKRVF